QAPGRPLPACRRLFLRFCNREAMTTSLKSSIFWHQGLFLEPQHFQHQDRALEALLSRHLALTSPWSWGFGALLFDESALHARSLSVRQLAVRWQDGAFTEFPGNARVESRRFELTDFAQGPRTAYLGLRRLVENEANVLRYEKIEEVAQSRSRYAALADPQPMPDLSSAGAEGRVACRSGRVAGPRVVLRRAARLGNGRCVEAFLGKRGRACWRLRAHAAGSSGTGWGNGAVRGGFHAAEYEPGRRPATLTLTE